MKIIKIKDIKSKLNNSENPLFIFDDDHDGLCSYVLLRDYIKKGRPFATKGGAILRDNRLSEKINEYNSDIIFILDVPVISQEFIDGLKCKDIVWIDHHEVVDLNGVYYYNPRIKDPKLYKPTTEICYEIVKGKDWIAGIGIIGDYKIPKFLKKLKKKYKDLFNDANTIEEIIYANKFGKLIDIINYNLKGKNKDIKKFMETIPKIKDPYEILESKTENGKFIYQRYKKFMEKYKDLLNKALESGKTKDDLFWFLYAADTDSFTGELAQEIKFKLKNKIVFVGREKSGYIRFSLRSPNMPIRDILKKVLQEFNGTGGGHELACGGSIRKNDFDEFIKSLAKEFKKKQS